MRRRSFTTIIVGQSSLIREGVVRILRSANFRIVASVSCADELPPEVLPDRPLFLIIHTGNDFDFVLEQIESFGESHPGGRIAIVADRYRPDELVSAFRAGASGYFVDVMTCDVFIKSLELVMMGETVLPPAFLPYVLGPEEDHMEDREPRAEESEAILVTTSDAMAPQLSPREKLILRCLIEGDSNKCIARKMDITEATVKVHVKAILRKIRVHNRTQAAIWGMNNGWSRQATDPITPSLPSRTPRQLASAISPVAPIEQNEPPVSAGMIAQANHAELSGFETLIRKDANLKTDITIRSRKQ